MILPTKRLKQDRSLLYIGSEILQLLNEPKTVSRLWEEFRHRRNSLSGSSSLTYDWFVLALDLLYSIQAVDYAHGRVEKVTP